MFATRRKFTRKFSDSFDHTSRCGGKYKLKSAELTATWYEEVFPEQRRVKRKRKRGSASCPCPSCSAASYVLETRRSSGLKHVVRKRRCRRCKTQFWTE